MGGERDSTTRRPCHWTNTLPCPPFPSSYVCLSLCLTTNNRTNTTQQNTHTPTRTLCDYLLYAEGDARRALELATAAQRAAGQEDWWWAARVGKAQLRLGLAREAATQLETSLRRQDMVSTVLELAQAQQRLGQPRAALALFTDAAGRQPWEPALLLGAARAHDALGEADEALAMYERVREGEGEREQGERVTRF